MRFRAPLMLLYDATTDVDHWPFDSLVQWTYDIIGFEGEDWPGPGHRIRASCLVLNSGYAMIPLIVALTPFLVWSPLTRFLEAGTLIGLDTYTTSSALAAAWYQLFWQETPPRKLNC